MSEATTVLLAYHGKKAIKQKYLRRVRQHRLADELVQGYGYWQGGKGCGVGCTIHSNEHARYETELGVPVRLAYLEDAIFEGLPSDEAKFWPERFLEAITEGADLSRVWNQFAHWLLTDSGLLTITDVNREAIEAVAALHSRAAAGEAVADSEWSAAAESAESAESAGWAARSAAAWSAESAESAGAAAAAARSAESAASAAAAGWAARSAESAARSAESAESAGWAARSAAAWSAGWAARSAAESAYSRMAAKLLELLAAAPVR